LLVVLLIGAALCFFVGLWVLGAADDLLGLAWAGLGAAALGTLVRLARVVERRAR
jgi:hypothetical protein